MTRHLRRAVDTAFSVLVLSMLASCGGGKTSPTVSPPTLLPAVTASPAATPAPPSAVDILSAASARLAATATVRFSLHIDGVTYIDDAKTIQLLEARGGLVRPDKVSTDFKIKVLGGVNVSMKLIIVAKNHWSTDLVTGKWGIAPTEFGYNPSILFDNQGGIGPVMQRVTDPVQLEGGTIRGRSTVHVRGNVEEAAIAPLTSNTMRGSPVTVDLWIDPLTNDLLRARLTEPANTEGRQPAVWTLDLADQGSDLKIDPPI